MAGRQRLGAEDVERGASEAARVEQRQQVLLDQVRAARHVDEVAARLQLGERVAVEDVLGVGRQRQQADEDAGRPQERIELLRAGEAPDAVDGLGRAAPAGDREFELRHRARHPFAQHAEPHDADREVRALVGPPVRPLPLRDLALVHVEFAEVPHDRVADEFGHLHRHAGVVESHELRPGRQAQLQQRVDPGAEVEDALELRLLVEQLLRRRPDHGVVGGRGARLPLLDVGARQGGAERVDPGRGLGVGGAEEDSHDLLWLAQLVIAGLTRRPSWRGAFVTVDPGSSPG